jgi:DNA-directed RNA polymerase subunit omega
MDLRIIEDALIKYPNRFSLTMMAAARAKELNEGDKTVLEKSKGDKPIVQALEELAQGAIVPGTREEMALVREARRAAREKALMDAEEKEAEELGDLSTASPDPAPEA